MTIEQKVYALLSVDAGVLALMGSGGASRIKQPGDWQNMPLPYIVHFPVAPSPEYTHEGLLPLTNWSYQVSVFGTDAPITRALSVAVRTALSGQHGGVNFFWSGQTVAPFDENVKIAHVALDFDVWEAL